jgi:hypothetical protein
MILREQVVAIQPRRAMRLGGVETVRRIAPLLPQRDSDE